MLETTTKPLKNNFDDALYPHERTRNLAAILLLVVMHLILAYLLVYKKVEQPVKQGDEKGELVFLDLPALNERNPVIEPPQPEKQQKQAKKKQQRKRIRSEISKPVIKSPPASIASQIAAAKEKRQALEKEAAQQNQEAQLANKAPSEDDIALARIKANINAAIYDRKGKNGIFQVTSKGVQTGRFTFRGWNNDPRESTWQSFEVDAGVGGDVELALIRKMIEIIREHYKGDFNWESQRLGRVVVLSARPEDSADLEKFLRKEFFSSK